MESPVVQITALQKNSALELMDTLIVKMIIAAMYELIISNWQPSSDDFINLTYYLTESHRKPIRGRFGPFLASGPQNSTKSPRTPDRLLR